MPIKKTLPTLILLCALIFSGCTRFNPEAARGDFQNKALEKIGLEITTHLGDHQTFVEGDPLSFFLNLEREAYLLVIYEDAAGHLTQIIPNAINQNGYSPSGMFMPLPEENAPYRFKVQAPFGKETVWVFAADRAFQKLEGKKLANGLIALKRGLSVIIKKIRTKKMTAFGEATLTIETQNKI